MDEREPLPLRDAESIDIFLSRIPHYYEKQFALLLLSIPTLDVQYEPHRLTGIYQDESRTTKPDFFVVNTRNPRSNGAYIELTSVENPYVDPAGRAKDPKARQRAILEQNGAKHIIFYRGNLEYIEHHRGIDFQLNKKIVFGKG